MKTSIVASGVVRDCFLPSSIVLGSPRHPLRPELNCTMRHIAVGTDDVQTCLCTRPFCNDISLESINATKLESKSNIISTGASNLLERNQNMDSNGESVNQQGIKLFIFLFVAIESKLFT